MTDSQLPGGLGASINLQGVVLNETEGGEFSSGCENFSRFNIFTFTSIMDLRNV